MNSKERLHDYMNVLHGNNHFNGAVLVANNGEILLNEGFGYASFRYDVLNTPQTKFRIGSLSKAFTAAAILLLQKQGKLKVSNPINQLLEDYPQGDKITMHHLLTHSSGVADFTFSTEYWEKTMRLPSSLEQSIERFKNKPLEFEPGERMDYRNTGYLLLTAIIEKVSGITYREFLQENILNPLEMSHTGVDDGRTIVKNLSSGYSVWEQVIQTEFVDMSIPLGAYGLYSTIEDLYKWGAALKNGLLIGEELSGKMFSSYLGGYGYGWFIDESTRKRACHLGDINGFTNDFQLYLEEDVVIIVLSNLNITPVGKISTDLAKIVFGETISGMERVAVTNDPWGLEIFEGLYKSEETELSIELKGGKLYVTIPKMYGAVYKYELRPLRLTGNEAHFKANFINEDFIFEKETHAVQFIDVYNRKIIFYRA